MRSVPGSRCASRRAGCSARCAPDIPAVQVKVGIGGERSPCDLRRRRGLKRWPLLQKAGIAVSWRGVESQYCAEGAAMDQALARVAARLETERVDVWSPGARHSGARHAVRRGHSLRPGHPVRPDHSLRPGYSVRPDHSFRSGRSSSQQPTCGMLCRRRGPVTARTARCKQSSPGETGSAIAPAQGRPRQPVAAPAPGAALR